jgi:hypothetical protein
VTAIVRAGAERIPDVEPLSAALVGHHAPPAAPHWGLGVVAANEAAIRFYRRPGLRVAFLELLGRP